MESIIASELFTGPRQDVHSFCFANCSREIGFFGKHHFGNLETFFPLNDHRCIAIWHLEYTKIFLLQYLMCIDIVQYQGIFGLFILLGNHTDGF